MPTLLAKKQKRYRLTVPQIVDEIDWAEMRDLSITERCEVVREILAEDAEAATSPYPMTLREVARVEGVTPERCRQVEAKALQKCRRFARRLRVNERDLSFERDVQLHQGNRRTR